ncbi:hypothetical protein TNCV_1821451 [Trichonephila clavipes]|nr:hypothetical protein TNCV_1821451 [Trichonephila clavipes]
MRSRCCQDGAVRDDPLQRRVKWRENRPTLQDKEVEETSKKEYFNDINIEITEVLTLNGKRNLLRHKAVHFKKRPKTDPPYRTKRCNVTEVDTEWEEESSKTKSPCNDPPYRTKRWKKLRKRVF